MSAIDCLASSVSKTLNSSAFMPGTSFLISGPPGDAGICLLIKARLSLSTCLRRLAACWSCAFLASRAATCLFADACSATSTVVELVLLPMTLPAEPNDRLSGHVLPGRRLQCIDRQRCACCRQCLASVLASCKHCHGNAAGADRRIQGRLCGP